MPYTIRDFRVNSLPGVPIPNSRYYVPNGNGTDLNEYLTDLTGAYRLVGSAGSPSTDEKVKVSSNDTTPGFLNGKLVVGAGISFLENNNGGNETLTISHVDTSSAINLDTSGAQVIDLLTFDTFGHVQTVTTRDLTPTDIGVPNAWNLLGNSGTDQTVNFVGTLDTQGIQFRTNNNIAGLIENSEPLAPVFARGTGSASVLFGSHAGENLYQNPDLTKSGSTLIGTYAGRFSKSGANTFVGFHAGYLHTFGGANGGRNTALGVWAFNSGYKAYDCTALGTFAFNNLFEGVAGTAVGRDAAKSLTYGNGINAIGSYSLLNNSTGISGITITNGGSGYTTATITFSAPQFGPNGGNCSITATGTAIISSGSIVGVTMTEPGCGYMKLSADEHFTELGLDYYWYATTVTITGDGIGATATPIFVYPEGNVGLGGYSGLYDRFGFYNTYLGNNTYSSNWRWYDKYSLFAGFGAAVDTSIPSGTAIEKSVAIGYNARVGQSNSIILGGTGADQPNVGIGTIAPNPLRFLDVRSDIDVNGLRLGRGQGNINSNAIFGFESGYSLTSGIANTGVGYRTLKLNTTGGYNTAFGWNSLVNNQTATLNTAVGVQTFINLVSSAANTAIGSNSFYTYTGTGVTNGWNVGVGNYSGFYTTIGHSNTFIGSYAGSSNQTGYNNIALGIAAFGGGFYLSPGVLNSAANDMIAVGALSLQNAAQGGYSIGIGFAALRNSNGSVGKNIGIGYNSGVNITSGNYNVIIGGNDGTSIATLHNHVIIADGNGNSKLRFNDIGKATLPTYGIGTHTGTGAYTLQVDASGNVIEAAIGGGGSGETNTASNLGGGLANYSTKVGVDLQFNSFNATDFDLASNLISIDATLKGNWDAASSWVTTNGANAVTAFGWGDWSTGVNKTFVDALNVDADTLDGIDSTGFALSSHTHLLAAGATDVTATAAEVNLLDLSGLTAGWALLADSATTASWQAIPAGATTFIGLTDTDPANYSGSAGYLVRVNSTPNGLEFVDGTTLFASTSHTHAISTDITGLGTGIATALAVNTGSAGAPILYNGNAGTPSALVGTNITGTASGLTAGAVTGFTAGAGTLTGPASSGVAVTLGNNETITGVKTMSGLNVIQHSSSGLTVRNPANTFTYTFTGGAIAANRTLNIPVITGTDTLAVLGLAQTFTGVQTFTSPATTTSITTASTSFTAWAGATTLLTIGGTGASASMFAPSTLDTTSSTTGAIRTSGGISAAKALNIGTTATIGSTIELGHASDTTLSRVSAGTIAVEGVTVATSSNSLALTNKSVNGVTLVSGGTATLYLSQDGTYTTPSGSGTNVYGEEHTGLTGTTVTLSNSGTTGTLRIYKNGVRLDSTEFSYSGGTSVTVTDTLDSGDMIICDYKY